MGLKNYVRPMGQSARKASVAAQAKGGSKKGKPTVHRMVMKGKRKV